MTFQDVADLAAAVGIPSAYYQFNNNTKQAPPFLCFIMAQSDDAYADNSNYQKIERVQFELYTEQKDFALEATVERVLANAGITWSRNEGFLDSEHMHMTTYQFDAVITEV
jgi:protein-disulfide isomerase-like protein with CxxC motif